MDRSETDPRRIACGSTRRLASSRTAAGTWSDVGKVFSYGHYSRRITARNSSRHPLLTTVTCAPGPRGRRDPPLRRALVGSARGAPRDGGAGPVHAEPARGRLPRGPRHLASGDLRRVAVVLRLGGRHGPGRLREQRQPRGLRGAAAERHRPARQDRRRALLEPVQLSRLQGAHGATRGRGGDDRLLRPGRGRLRARGRVPQGTLGTPQPHPARRHRLRFHRAWRPPHPWLGLDPRRTPSRERGRRLGAAHRRGADVLPRHPADPRAPGRTARADGVEGRASPRVSPGRRRGPPAHQGGHADGRAAEPRGGGPHSRHRAPGRVGRAREPP